MTKVAPPITLNHTLTMSSPPPAPTPTTSQPAAPEEKENKWQDCTYVATRWPFGRCPQVPADASACRLTGAATFSGMGLYALYEAGQQGAFAKVRPKGSPRGASITAALGVGESSPSRGCWGVRLSAGLGREQRHEMARTQAAAGA